MLMVAMIAKKRPNRIPDARRYESAVCVRDRPGQAHPRSRRSHEVAAAEPLPATRNAESRPSGLRTLFAPAAANDLPDQNGGDYRRGQGECRLEQRFLYVVPDATDLWFLY